MVKSSGPTPNLGVAVPWCAYNSDAKCKLGGVWSQASIWVCLSFVYSLFKINRIHFATKVTNLNLTDA